ncbi:TPA: glycyl radical protein [Candidatus Poribacteria bacterium]|nr:glycyl radical protein [Candidatus Poribacteria bacterium]
MSNELMATDKLLIDPFSYAYMNSVGEAHEVRLARAIYAQWSTTPAVIDDTDLIVGRMTDGHSIAGFNFGGGVTCNTGYAEQLIQEHPDRKEEIEAIVQFWRDKTVDSHIHWAEDEQYLSGQNIYWAGWGGHAILDFTRILAGGTCALRERIRNAMTMTADEKKLSFHKSLLIMCDAIDAFAQNYAETAQKMALEETDAKRKRELEEIAKICSRAPHYGASSFREALQTFWFIHLLDGTDSPGRFDQYMFPYYKKDIENDDITKDEAQSLIDHLWQRFNEVRSWNLCVGGLKPDGTDGTNDLTYMCLEATRRCQKIAPNLSLRLHQNSPDELWMKALEVIATGVGMPALYNDDILIPAMMRYGITEEDARDYAMNGCSQIDIQGKSHMGLEDGEVNLLKCLELALNNGFDPLTKQQIGPKTGDKFESFDDVMKAYKKQVEYATMRVCNAANIVQQAHAETSPNLFRSLFVDDCIDEGMDFKAGGPRYNHGQILTQGIANTADSLAVIKKLVFEEKSVSMAGLMAALQNNFPDEKFRQRLINEVSKYGNDDGYVDSIAQEIVAHFYTELNQHRTWRGGTYGGGSIVFTRAVSFGRHVGATPDGRRAYTILVDSVGPTRGLDRNGPTAMLKSVARTPQILAQSTYLLNMKFTPSVLRSNKEKVMALLKTYFKEGGQQVQVNVVDRKTLLRAKADPDNYSNLVVRVGGFSDYFTQLSHELQEDIIARTEHEV